MKTEFRERLVAIIFCLWVAVFSFAAVLSLHGCAHTPQTQPQAPQSELGPSPNPSATPNSSVVDTSVCAHVNWRGQGKMPTETLNGFIETFKKSVCAKRAVLTQPVATAQTDGFAIYKVEPTLANLYALLLSAAMYESGGDVCTGRDTSAGAKTSTEAESGLLQQSANVMNLNPALKDIYNEYKAHPEKCGFSTFSDTACSMYQSVDGPGLEFQKMMRTCPALAIEQAAIGFRVGIRHWGPARRGILQFEQSCADMLGAIQKAVVCK